MDYYSSVFWLRSSSKIGVLVWHSLSILLLRFLFLVRLEILLYLIKKHGVKQKLNSMVSSKSNWLAQKISVPAVQLDFPFKNYFATRALFLDTIVKRTSNAGSSKTPWALR